MKKASMEMHACFREQLKNVSPSVTPEAGAADTMKACEAQLQAHLAAGHALIKKMPEGEQAAAVKDFSKNVPNMRKQLAESISERRAKASAQAAKP
jgi:hypothetical protein